MTLQYYQCKKPTIASMPQCTTEQLVAWGSRLGDEFEATMANQWSLSDADHDLWVEIYATLEVRARAGDMDAAVEITRNEMKGSEGP